MHPSGHTFMSLNQELDELDGFLSTDFSVPKIGTQPLRAESRPKVSKSSDGEANQRRIFGVGRPRLAAC